MKKLDYPAKLISIYIVADHCSDNTAAIAREAGAVVHERNTGPRGGKGTALNWLFAQIFSDENPESLYNEGIDAVLIFDADLGLGNLDVLLGLVPKYNLSHVIGEKKRLSEIIVAGPGGIHILPASSGIQELTRLSSEQKKVIFHELNMLLSNYDFVLFDTAAGISSNVLSFNASANEIMIVVTPEPTSITDAYALIKILSVDYQEKKFGLIVNLAKNTKEADEVSRHLCLVVERFLDVSIEHMGSILADENVKKGVRKQKIVSAMAPMTDASRNFSELTHRLIQSTPVMSRSETGYLIGQDIF